MTEYLELARACGFTAAVPLDTGTLQFLPEVREMCAADKCSHYNKSWACPPACGSLDALREKCAAYTHGIIVQTTVQLESSFDFEGITELGTRHSRSFLELTDRFRALGLDILPMGAGTCTRCESCTWPDAPCRFPDRVFPSMEACGLFVSQVCKDNNIPYYYGPNTMTFVSCYLMK